MSNKLVLVEKTEMKVQDDFQNVGALIRSSLEERKSRPDDELTEKFLNLIPDVEDAELDVFLFSIAKMVNSITPFTWATIYASEESKTSEPVDIEGYRKKVSEEEAVALLTNFVNAVEERDSSIGRYKEYIYDRFGIEPLENKNPLNMKVSTNNDEVIEVPNYALSLGTNKDVADFFIKIFKTVIRIKGITDGLAYAYADAITSWKEHEFEVVSQGKIRKQLYNDIVSVLKNRQFLVWEKEVKKEQPSDIISLFRFLELKNEEGENTDDICLAILRAIPNASDVDCLELCDNFFWQQLSDRNIVIEFMDDYGDYKDFMESYLHEADRFDKVFDLISAGGFFLDYYNYNDEDIVKQAKPEAIFKIANGDYIDSWPPTLFLAGKAFLLKNEPVEALYCFKKSLLDSLFYKKQDGTELTYPDIESIIDATRKTVAYADMIKLLSVFPVLAADGWPLNAKFLREVELLRARLEFEFKPQVTNNLLMENYNKTLQTHEKIDFMTNVQRAILKQSEIILSVIQEGDKKILKAINENADKIIDRLHSETLRTWEDKSLTHSGEEFYKGYFNAELWEKLDEMTKKFLCIAHYLYTHIVEGRNIDLERLAKEDAEKKVTLIQLDEFGFIGIEYAKAIENEFCRKIINNYYKTNDQIITDGGKLIIPKPQSDNEYPTLGTIHVLINRFKNGTVNNEFSSFLNGKNIGEKITSRFYGTTLHKIYKLYRNPAAHPCRYTRDTLNSFRNLLFGDEQFLKKFLGDIQ